MSVFDEYSESNFQEKFEEQVKLVNTEILNNNVYIAREELSKSEELANQIDVEFERTKALEEVAKMRRRIEEL